MRSPPLRRASLALLLLLLGAACSEPKKPAPILDERHVITVDGTTVRYNGKLLDWNGTVKDWEKVLGPATRVVRDISVWDDLGVYVYHNTGRPNPAELDLLLSRTHLSPATIDEPDFWPRGPFRGRLVVDGSTITTGTTIGDINARKNGTPFRRGHLPSIFESEADGFLLGISVGFDGNLRTFSMSPGSRN